MTNAVIIIPTYNERDNIVPLLSAIYKAVQEISEVNFSVLVVDDSSPDGTAELVKEYMQQNSRVYLLTGEKEGLGKAYIRGMQYALDIMQPDIVFEMDADFSHDLNLLPVMIEKINEGSDFVIGSRYVPGGSVPENWPWIRKQNSRWGNRVARLIMGISEVKDCTSGYRAIRASTLRSIRVSEIPVSGYVFQVALLQRAKLIGAKIVEVPLKFTDRTKGVSKIRVKDALESLTAAFKLRFWALGLAYGWTLVAVLLVSLVWFEIQAGLSFPVIIVCNIATLMAIQGLYNVYLLLHAWNDPVANQKYVAPNEYRDPKFSFTALLPAKNEELVIGQTIRSLAEINYPKEKSEVIVICRSDDTATIEAAKFAISQIPDHNIQLAIFPETNIANKPHGLNIGLEHASGDVVVIFDAEDEPHKEIYNLVNTVMVKDNADVVQSGVQLMNFQSNWYSLFNVLEYFFWFKSVLPYYAKQGVVPLGGNTVFFKRQWLKMTGGWDENCLTEDGDIGIRMSLAGANIRVIYDAKYATQEETPPTLESFIKQRTRWNQGFMQILAKGHWLKFLSFKHQALALYVLVWPEIQAFLFLYIPVSIVMSLLYDFPVWTTMLATIPMYLLALQLLIAIIGLYEFCKNYNIRWRWYFPIKMVIVFFPYQILLGTAAIRAIYRGLKQNTSWEKTMHINAHRLPEPSQESEI